jgi:integrase
MPKKAKELSALAVSRLRSEGRFAVGGADGLHLRVVGNSRAWVLRLAVGTRIDQHGNPTIHRRDIGLGGYPEVSLAEAREKARAMRKQARDGIDPIAHKYQQREAMRVQRAKTKTFRECARVVIANKSRELKSSRNIANWQASLETYAYPVIGDKNVDDITRVDIAAILEPIWQTKNQTASRVRGRMETVFDYAKAMEYRTGDNPAEWKGTLEPILGRIKHKPIAHPSLPYSELGTFMVALRKHVKIKARALEFIILTAARANEVFGATWEEVDLQEKIWTIPAERMKAGKEHRVPLSASALRLLQELPRIEGTRYLFPSPSNGKILAMALTTLIKNIHQSALDEGKKGFVDFKQKRIITTHGFRSTFRDWAAEQTHYPREVCEHALAHKLPDAVEAAYLRSDFLEKRRLLMTDWANHCAQIPPE